MKSNSPIPNASRSRLFDFLEFWQDIDQAIIQRYQKHGTIWRWRPILDSVSMLGPEANQFMRIVG